MSAVEIIAEIGSVHDGSFGNACQLVRLAARLGADTVKFQTHIAEAETTPDAPSPPFFSAESRFDYFRRTAFDLEQYHALARLCEDCGVRFLSTPFSIAAVELLEEVGVTAYKVASGEVTNTPMLERMAATGKPIMLSSGMSSWGELDEAVEVLRPRCAELTVLQCTSAYPCPPERVGLNVLAEMRERYGLPVGFSDHSDGIAAALAATTLGACVVEKHLTFSRDMYGSDAANATEPATFAAMVEGIRQIALMRKHPVDKDDLAPYAQMKPVFEKSIVLSRPVRSGEVLGPENLTTMKPGTGIAAREFTAYLGRRVTRDLPAYHMLSPEEVD